MLAAVGARTGGRGVEAARRRIAAPRHAGVVARTRPRPLMLTTVGAGTGGLVVKAPPAGVVTARHLAGVVETRPGSHLGAGEALRWPARDWGCHARRGARQIRITDRGQ